MKTTNISHIAHLVEICYQKGVRNIVLSPGSRNAPLIIAFDSHPEIKTYLVHDERSAAYFAMGIAEEMNEPVAVACTSGSAALNYSPAISEAFFRNIPLLILTADRPVDLVDQGDGQTIRQKNVFENHIKHQVELPDFPSEEELKNSDVLVNQALNELNAIPKAPVHINIPLREPLYETKELSTQPEILASEKNKFCLGEADLNEIKTIWKSSEKKLLMIGQRAYQAEFSKELKLLIQDPSLAVLVENTSNTNDFHKLCHCIDRTLVTIKEHEIASFAPDLLITIGDAIISKKIKAFFRINKPNHHWDIGNRLFEKNTYQSLTKRIEINEVEFLKTLNSEECLSLSNFGNKWKQRDFEIQPRHDEFIENSEFSDLKIFDFVLNTMPDDSNLHMGNSSVVRYCQLFDPVQNIRYYSNRGVSGIDGSMSTAVGIAEKTQNKLNLVITGDISFFYDSNALWNNYLHDNLRIIVVNNGGGGIFKFIPGPTKTDQSDLFYAPYNASVSGVCETFGINYLKASSLTELERLIGSFYDFQENGRPVILEIDTSKVSNQDVLNDYFRFISQKK